MSSLAILEILVSLAVQATVLVGITAWLACFTKFRAEADRCWAVAHGSLLVMAIASFMLPHPRLVTWAALHPTRVHPMIDEAAKIVGWSLTSIWLLGMFFCVVVCVAGMIRATLLVGSSKVDRRLSEYAGEHFGAGASVFPIEIRTSELPISPFCWQFHRPVIVLPKAVRAFPMAEQSAILRHEFAHLRLQHPLQLFLQRLIEAVYWFHPLVWWASRQANAEREYRCDREAVRSRSEVADYLRSLLRMVELHVGRDEAMPSRLSFLSEASLLSQRACRLGNYSEQIASAPPLLRKARVSIVVCAILCSTIWLPVNPLASRRSYLSPWPTWSARVLSVMGLEVRDYEVDGHRLAVHENAR
ncbi:MAG: M56 family metallopeptidase [Pirellulales bacterium]|nr:M56 family metallopeptidase [Pirellulales bacterium]